MSAPHGTRARYKTHCPCTPCRAAEAAYRAQLRRLRVHGRQPLGILVSAAATWRQLRALESEGISRRMIADTLGLARPRIDWACGPGARMRLRTVLRVRAIWRRWCDDEPDAVALVTKVLPATHEGAHP